MRFAIRGWWSRRALKLAALVAGGVLVASAIVYALRWRIFGRLVRAAARSAIGDVLDAEVVVGDATGSIVRSIELRDVRVFPKENSPLGAPGRIDRLRVSLSLLGRIRGVEIEGVAFVLAPPADPSRPWDEMLGDVLSRLDERGALPTLTFADVRIRIGATAVNIDSGSVVPTEHGFDARAALNDEGLPRWAGRSREVWLRTGLPEVALEAGASCVTDHGTEGLSFSLGLKDEGGVRSLRLASTGAAPAITFAGRLAPGRDGRLPRIISGMLEGKGVPADRVARAAGVRGIRGGTVSFECALAADLRLRTLKLDVKASASSIVIDTRALATTGRTGSGSVRFAIDKLRAVAHAEGPLVGGLAEWTVAPLDATLERADIAGIPVDRIDIISRFERGRLVIVHAGLSSGDDRLDLAGPVDPFALTGELTFVLSARDLAPYVKPFAVPLRQAGPLGAEGRIEADESGVRIFAEVESRHGRLISAGDPGIDWAWEELAAGVAYGEGIVALSNVRVRGGPGGLDYSVEATVVPDGGPDAARGAWEIASCVIRAGPDRLELAGRIGPGGIADLDVKAAVELPPRWLPENVASLVPARGRASFVGSLDVVPGNIEVRGDLDASGLDIGGAKFEAASARAVVWRRTGGGEETVLGAELRDIVLESDGAGIALAADVLASSSGGRIFVELRPKAMTFRGDAVTLPARVAVNSLPEGDEGGGGIRVEPFELSWRGVTLSAEGEFSGSGFRASLSAETDSLGQALRPDETGLPDVMGAGYLSAYFAGSRAEGWGVVWADGEGLSVGDLPLGRLAASAFFEWPGRASRASVSPEVELFGPLLSGYLSGTFPLGEAEAGARVELEVFAEAFDLAALASGDPDLRRELRRGWNAAEAEFRLAGTVDDPKGQGWIGLAREARALRVADFTAGGLPTIPFTYSRGVLAFRSTAIPTPWGVIEIGGDLPARLVFEPYPRLAAGEGATTLRARMVAGDVSALAPFMPEALRALRPSGGFIATARPEGVFPDLEVVIDFALRDGTLSPPAPVARVEDVSVDATLRGGKLTFSNISASMGHGAIEATGSISLDSERRMSFSVKGRDVLVVGGDELPVRARADLDLRIAGDREGAKVTGSVAVTTVSYSAELPVGKRGPVPEDPADALAAFGVDLQLAPEGGVALRGVAGLRRLAFDIEIKSAGEARLENSFVAGIADFHLRLRGTGAAPSASGTVIARRGEVRVFPGVFLPVDEFRLDMPPEPGAEPRVVFRSSATSGLTRIFISATGPISQPVVTLYSEPPYPQEDLVMLLAFGQAPGTPARPDRALVSPAARVLSGLLADRFPRTDPAASAFWKLRFALGTEAEHPTELVPLPEPALPDRGLILRAEYLVTDYLSILTEEDELGDIGADVRLRFRWPRRKEPRPLETRRAPPEPEREPAAYTVVGNRKIGTRRIGQALEPELRRAAVDGWTAPRLSDAAYRIRRLYRDVGYHFAEVASGADEGWAVFSIDEGPFVPLGRVYFRGNEAISDEALRKALFSGTPRFVTTPFSRRLAAAQADSVRARYLDEGFLDVNVEDPRFKYVEKDQRMDVTILVEEGPRFVLGEVAFVGAPPSDVPELAALVDRNGGNGGKILRASLPHHLARKVRDFYREQGRPEARCTPRLVLDNASATGRLVLDVSPARVARAGKVKVVGNAKAAAAHIEHLTAIEPGEILAASTLRAAERRLIETDLFRSVRILPLWPDDALGRATRLEGTVVDVEVRVEEVPHLEAIFSGGFGTFDGFRVGIDLGTRNAFGHGEKMHAGIEVSERGFRALGEAKFPCGGRKSSIFALTAIFESREQKSFEVDYLGFSPSISRRVTRRDELRAGVRFDSIRTTNIAPGVPPGDLLDFDNVVPFVTILSDRRDSYINPHRGYVFTAQIEGSSIDLGSDVSYTRISTLTSIFVPLSRDVTVALSVHGGVTQPQKGTDVLPIALRYFAGGIGTVRGLPDRELGPMVGGSPSGGEVFLAATAEFRFRIWRNLFGAVFADRGGVFATTDDVDLGGARSGYGLGLRYLTPAGFVVVDIGFNPDPLPGEDDSIVYLTFGLPF